VDLITETIAIGNHVEAGDAELLASLGITGLLCLAADRMRAAPPAGIEKDSWPLLDGAGNTRSDLEGALRKLERLASRHTRVLVHCNAGRSRSCALVALFLARREKLAFAVALARVAARRPSMGVAPALLDSLESLVEL
jgi:atypical dual specificity phosphatase